MIPKTDEQGDPILDENDDIVMVSSLDEYNNPEYEQQLDDQGDPIFETKPAKDPLMIEQMDVIGVCLATIKELHAQVQALTIRVNALENP